MVDNNDIRCMEDLLKLKKRDMNDDEYKLVFKHKNKLRQQKYFKNNKTKCYENFTNYRKNNLDKFNQYQKDYYKNNRDEILKNKKVFYDNNKDEIIIKQLEYYNKNKDVINQKRRNITRA